MENDPHKPTILRNPNAKKKNTEKVISTNSTNKTNFGSGKKVHDDDELPKQTLVGKETGLKISQARLAKGFKQKDVAKYMNMDAGLYQKYENGTAPRNGQILNKLGKYLGIKLTGKGV
jgi:ribosome-binding protein aMBF1 (putative translation factor)